VFVGDLDMGMRLLVVHERFGAFGGAEENILSVAVELKQRGHAIGILHGTGTGKREEAWREAFTAQFPLSSRNNASVVQRALADFRPDVIYVHKMPDLGVLEELVAMEVPLVRMVHDHDLYCMRSCKYSYFSRTICTRPLSPYCVFPCGAFVARNHEGRPPFKWVSYSAKKREIELNRRFHRLIVNSRYVGAELLHNGFAAEKIELHPPVPNSNAVGERSSFSDRNLIIYAGQIVRGKGVDVLLESLARVRAPFECFILGDGNHRSSCEQLSRKLGLADRVQFKGYVPAEELNNYYREASLVVVSSVWPEPFGMVGIEAMRHGLPIVAFDAGGIKEWLIDGDNGYLVPWMDRVRYAARVEELLQNKTLARQMGGRGLLLVSAQYDFSRYINGLEKLFARVVEEAQCGVCT